MDRETLTQALEYADLTSYQAEAYLTLLELGVSPAIDVGRESTIPVSQVYDVLRSLEAKGYVETIERDKLYVRPLDPEESVVGLETRGELLRDAADEIRKRYRQPGRMDSRVSVTKRAETAVENATTLINEAETVIELAGTYDQLQLLEPALKDACERGVVICASVDVEDGERPPEGFDPVGVVTELRECTIPGPFLVIVDRHRTCFAPNTRADENYGVLVHDRILPFVFHWYYLTCLWDPYPTTYMAESARFTYVTIEEFIRDNYAPWTEGRELAVRVNGIDLATEQPTTAEGTVVDLSYLNDDQQVSRLTLSDLSATKTVTLATDDGTVTVGGWGAVFENIEMRTISLVAVDGDESNLASTDD